MKISKRIGVKKRKSRNFVKFLLIYYLKFHDFFLIHEKQKEKKRKENFGNCEIT